MTSQRAYVSVNYRHRGVVRASGALRVNIMAETTPSGSEFTAWPKRQMNETYAR